MKGEERVEPSGVGRAGKGAGQQKSGKACQSAREDFLHRGRLTGFPVTGFSYPIGFCWGIIPDKP